MNLTQVLKSGKRKYGASAFLQASSAPRDYPRLPASIFPLDWAFAGGIPLAVTSSLWGPPGSAKTYIAQRLLARAAEFCFRCYQYDWDCSCKEGPLHRKSLFLDVEGGFDWGWAEDIGVPPDLDLIEGLVGEEYVDILHSAIRSEDVGFIVMDSIADLLPVAELEGSAGDTFVATQARLVSYMIRKAKTLLLKEKRRGHLVGVLFLNQVRSKFGQGFGQPTEETPGGHASKHDFHLSARTGKRSVSKKDSFGLPEHTTVSISLASSLCKKKLFVMAGACQFDVVTSVEHEFKRGAVLDFETTFQYGEDSLFIRREGSDIILPSGSLLKFTSKKAVLDHWSGNLQQYFSIQKLIIDAEKARRLA